MPKRFLIIITLSVAVFSEIVVSQSASAMEIKGPPDWPPFSLNDLEILHCEPTPYPPTHTLPTFLGPLLYGRLRVIYKLLNSNTYNTIYGYCPIRDLARLKKYDLLYAVKGTLLSYRNIQRDVKEYPDFFPYVKNEYRFCFKLLAKAVYDIYNSKLTHDVLIKTNKFLKKDPELLFRLYLDLLNFPKDQHDIAYRTFVTFLEPPTNHELPISPRVHNITCKNNKIKFSFSSSDSFEDSELEINDTIESIFFTHSDKKITMPESSEDSNQNTSSTTDLKNSTIKTETTTESSSTLTQSSSSNSQESFKDIMVSMPQKLIFSQYKFSSEELKYLLSSDDDGPCNNALNSEISTTEEQNSYGDRQVFNLSHAPFQTEEDLHYYRSVIKILLHNNGECNNALNTEASSEENSSVGDTRFFFRCNSIIYPEDRLKKGSVKKLPLKGSNQKSEEDK